MKKLILIMIVFLSAFIINAQFPTVKFYLENNILKNYDIQEIENISLLTSSNNTIMKIYSLGVLSASYPSEDIDSIKFGSDNNVIRNLAVYINGSTPQNHLLFDIDSIVFSIKTTSAPIIESIEPTEAITGDMINITGSGFGSVQGESSVTFTGAEAINYSSWNDTEIIVSVPDGAETGLISVIVNGVHSNGKNFKVIPHITEIDPPYGKVGDLIAIKGSGFGSEQGTSKVYFDDIIATEISSWNNNEINVIVPTDATSGKVSIKIKSLMSNEVDFAITEIPQINSINPSEVSIGSEITIRGKGFGSAQNGSTVDFNTTRAIKFKSWYYNEIICTVPPGTISGNITVTVNSVKSNQKPYTIKASVETVLISSGSFQMGNTGSMSSGPQSETPVHQVNITNSFYMSKYEILQDLYTSVMGSNPSNFKGDSLPVDRVSWYMAVDFCNKLSEREGLELCYTINGSNVTCNWNANGWRLPTEAEWEYACKAGTSTDFYNGSTESQLASAAWYSVNSGDATHPAGEKTPNNFGLYDMLGNLSELCWDWIGFYDGGSQNDPKGPSSGTAKVARGGSWHQQAIHCRSAMRGFMDTPDMQSSSCGFRIVRLD